MVILPSGHRLSSCRMRSQQLLRQIEKTGEAALDESRPQRERPHQECEAGQGLQGHGKTRAHPPAMATRSLRPSASMSARECRGASDIRSSTSRRRRGWRRGRIRSRHQTATAFKTEFDSSLSKFCVILVASLSIAQATRVTRTANRVSITSNSLQASCTLPADKGRSSPCPHWVSTTLPLSRERRLRTRN